MGTKNECQPLWEGFHCPESACRSNSQCSLHTIMSIMFPRRWTLVAFVQGPFFSPFALNSAVMFSSLFRVVCALLYAVSGENSVVRLTPPSCTTGCLWLLYHFEPFFSLNTLFEESYLFSSTLLFTVIFLCCWNIFGLFQLVFLFFVMKRDWSTADGLLDVFEMGLYHLFISFSWSCIEHI